ncbi:hypothetical protein CI610_03421 [invertebrate metagenome]|uniref:Uncharacterized protein n=1 Tax=invertebrate metagenome TaxID=1711999 RepID=A0A2H9T347_9ZZZZ
MGVLHYLTAGWVSYVINLYNYFSTLRKMVNEHQTNWDAFLDGALFAMRTKPQSSTKYSPFFLLYGREARYPSQLPKDFGNNLQVSSSTLSCYFQLTWLEGPESLCHTKYSICQHLNHYLS